MTNKIGNLVTLKNKYRYTSLFNQNGSEINIIISNEPLLILSHPSHSKSHWKPHKNSSPRWNDWLHKISFF